MVEHTDTQTLTAHVEHFTPDDSQVYTDEWQGYNHLDRPHSTVCHTLDDWARDDDGDMQLRMCKYVGSLKQKLRSSDLIDLLIP